MSETYTKLFSSITASSIWQESDHTRLVWVTMLAMADRNGYVGASVPGLAGIARVPVEACRAALEKFLSPDPDSRSPDHDGRRIEVSDRGWTLLNHERFRDMRDEDVRREYERNRKRAQRERQKREAAAGEAGRPGLSQLSRGVPPSPALSAQAATDPDPATDPEGDPEGRPGDISPEEMLVRRMKRGGGRLTGQMLADVFGHLRGQVVAHALPWVGARRPEKADAVAAAIGADAVAVGAVVPTMRRLLEKAHAGEIDMSKRVLEDPSFGFGTWAAGFSGLREDLARRAAGGRRPTEPRGGDREYPPMPE